MPVTLVLTAHLQGRVCALMLESLDKTPYMAIELTGNTRPLRVISPVMAVSERTQMSEKSEMRTVMTVTPADGPSLPTAPAGKWMWMSVSSSSSFRLRPKICAQRNGNKNEERL